ncbi:4Fe-4S binding protein [Helicovermis profundi]|uniref:4Fe-4S ferredoxin-type domain-containing protein n=1 Tax=Helicovermis profundi TaxID=3065157 RepID=A0AAU9E7X6_9FIRM|nr:hypothetical protein HLPR_11080 [Clostridia bacterium S502]
MQFIKKHIRGIIQLFIFTLVLLISINHNLLESGGGISWFSSASLHAVCPFGGVVTIYQLLTVGTFVKQIHAATLVLLVIVLLLAVFLGPVFCGWLCPLGSIQEWIGKIGKKIFGKKYNTFVNSKLDRVLRYFRYFVLVWVIIITARSGEILFQHVDPYYALFNFYTGEVAIQGLVILSLTLISSLFVERSWCKYACPYGALLGLTNKFSIFKIKRNKNTCVTCKKCDKDCPMNIEVSSKSIVTDLQCIRCMKCTSDNSCPIPETVDIKF